MPIFHDAITPTQGNRIQQDFTLQKSFHIEFEVLLTRSSSVEDSSLLHFGQDFNGKEGSHRIIGTTDKTLKQNCSMHIIIASFENLIKIKLLKA